MKSRTVQPAPSFQPPDTCTEHAECRAGQTLLEREANESYYCPEHKYNPPPNSGITLCPQCELNACNDIDDDMIAKLNAMQPQE